MCGPKKKNKQNKNNPHFHHAEELERITGVDLTRIDGVDVMVAQTVISEVGLDMSRWKSEAHFASWLGLCPDNRISGDKVFQEIIDHPGLVQNQPIAALAYLGLGRACALHGLQRRPEGRIKST